MPETTPLIKAALNLRVGAGFDVYEQKGAPHGAPLKKFPEPYERFRGLFDAYGLCRAMRSHNPGIILYNTLSGHSSF